MLHLDESTHLYEKILELAPQAVDKIQQMFSNKQNDSQTGKTNTSHTRSQQQGPKLDLNL
jgi:uncharacterized spore protein YtfJ